LLEITLDAEGEQRQAQAYASLLSAQNSLNSAKANYYNLQAAAFKANQTFINDAVARNLPTDDPTYIQENDAWLAAELNFNNAQDSIKSAQANLTNATIAYNQASSTVTAPLSGVVRNITVVPGMSVGGSNSSTILASIQTPGNPVATVNIAEVDVSKVKPGQKVTLTFDSIPDVTFTGKVAGINKLGVVSSGVTSYPATIQFDSTSDKILPNMAVQAAIITDVKEDVILVPSSSVTSSNGQTVVRTLRNGQLVAVPVTVGERSDSQTEIIDGVSEGEVVVTAIPNQNSRTNSSNNSSPFGGARGFGSFGGGGGNVRVFTR
jgi:multidrug efflux pump subunit AcrA (membrane-fusion protein)